jgi:DNA-binding LacI/PurR family transcriptional regulator
VRRHGWSVPKDVSVIGFDDIHFAEFFEPPLTTIRVSRRDLGETAFRALLNHNQPDVEGAGAHGVDYPLATTFVVRSSTAVARDQGKA